MKRTLGPTLAIMLLAATAAAQDPDPNPEPPHAPELSVVPGDEARTIIGAERFNLDDYAGRTVLLDFWASWCKPCRMSIPWLSSMQQKYQELGLTVIAVNEDRVLESAGLLLDDLDPRIVVVHDPGGELAAEFELDGMPMSFLFDAKGRMVASHVGFRAGEETARDREIYAALTGKGD